MLVSLSPSHPFPCLVSFATWQGWGLHVGSQHGFPLTQAYLAIGGTECQSPNSRDQLNSCYGTIPWGQAWGWGEPASHLVADWSHWTTSIIETAALRFQWSRYPPWIEIYLSCLQCLYQNHHLWPMKCLHGILHSIASDQEAHFIACIVWQ